MGYQQIILEGDSMLTVCALNQATPCMSGYGQMVEDIQVICCLSLPLLLVMWVEKQTLLPIL